MDVDREELAWAAGFFDGEGHVRTGGEAHFHIRMPQVDRRVLDRFRNAVGVGHIYGPRAVKGGQPQYSYQAAGHPTIQAICAMLWFKLGPVKREQFRGALTAAKHRPHRKYGGPCAHGVARTKDCRDCQHHYIRTYFAKPESLAKHRDKTRRFRLIRKTAHTLLVAV